MLSDHCCMFYGKSLLTVLRRYVCEGVLTHPNPAKVVLDVCFEQRHPSVDQTSRAFPELVLAIVGYMALRELCHPAKYEVYS